MLVLARGVGEVVDMLDGMVEIHVLSIQGSIVRLGFNAPREIPIMRKEIADRQREDHARSGS